MTTTCIKLWTNWHGHFFVLGVYCLPLQKGKNKKLGPCLSAYSPDYVTWDGQFTQGLKLCCVIWVEWEMPHIASSVQALGPQLAVLLERVGSSIGRSSLEKLSHWGNFRLWSPVSFQLTHCLLSVDMMWPTGPWTGWDNFPDSCHVFSTMVESSL